MQCTSPVLAVIPSKFGKPPESLFVPCGHCTMCRIAKSREWAIRCLHEMQEHKESVFATLTFNESFLPYKMDLNKNTLTKYLKRLRKIVEPRKIRYLASGEYGNIEKVPESDPDYWIYYARKFARPHYHLILFGLSLSEHKLQILHPGKPEKGYKCLGGPVYDAWRDPDTHYSMGFVVLGSVTYQSARYCVSYIFKQLDRFKGYSFYRGLQAPFQRQSQGLGKGYIDKHKEEICENMQITKDLRPLQLPRYYQKRLLTTPELKQQFRDKAAETDEELSKKLLRMGVKEEDLPRTKRQRREQRQRNVEKLIEIKEMEKRGKV